MKINKDEIDKDNHPKYDDYELSQFIVELDVGDKLEISVNGTKVKEYTARYVNCHVNAVFQDKGIKNKPPVEPTLQEQINDLNKIVNG